MRADFERSWGEIGAAVGWLAVSYAVEAGPPLRYYIPSETVLSTAVALSQAFDGLRLAALAVAEGNADATVTALKFMHSRLDLIHETLLAVVGEHEGKRDGTPRAC